MSDLFTLEIDGVRYCTATDVAQRLGVSRQTLWRWRQQSKIPSGYRFRDGRVLFTESETTEILQYAHRLEPIKHFGPYQMKLFDRRRKDQRDQ